MHRMYSILYVLLSMYVELTLKLVVDRPTNHPTNRQTDIVTYRAAIAAKNLVFLFNIENIMQNGIRPGFAK